MLAITISICLLFIILAPVVYARETGIRLTPSVIEIRPQQDGVIEKSITIENSGKDPMEVDIEIKAFTTDKSGAIVYPPDEKVDQSTLDFITNDIQVLENNIPIESLSLAPGQKQSLMVKINIKNIQNISQHTLSLFFISKNTINKESSSSEESPINTKINVSIGSAIHLLIFGERKDSSQSIDITSFQTNSFIQHGPVYFVAKVKNTSNIYINLYGNITITNMFGQQIGIVRIPNQLLPGNSEKELSGQATKAIAKTISWPDKLLLGKYKAKITLITETGNEVDSEVTFFAFPIKTILLILIAMFIASFVIGQVREKVK